MHLWQKFVGHVELIFCPLLQLSLLPVFFCSIPPKRGRGQRRLGLRALWLSKTPVLSFPRLPCQFLTLPHASFHPAGSVTCIPWDIHLVHLSLSFLPSLVAQMERVCLPMQETQDPSLVREDPLEKGTATHSSTLAWRIPWTEEPGGLQPVGSQRLRHDWVTNTSLLLSHPKRCTFPKVGKTLEFGRKLKNIISFGLEEN